MGHAQKKVRSLRCVVGVEVQRPQLSLRSKNKLRLNLRKMDFHKELDSQLPSDITELVELLLQSRSRVNGATYEIVSVWNKLRKYDRYWVNLRFHSEAHFLAHYCLPDGSTLATWTGIVELFDRDTFILLGEEVLVYMMKYVSQYQSSSEERKKDYQTIFTSYCRRHDEFSRVEFFKEVRNFAAKKYEEALAANAGLTHGEWLKKRSESKVITPHFGTANPTEDFFTDLPRNLKMRELRLLLNQNRSLLQDLATYAKKLEELVIGLVGEEKLPEKPEALRSL